MEQETEIRKNKRSKAEHDMTDQKENAFERQLKRRKRQRVVKTLITLFILAVIGLVGYQLYMYLKAQNEAENKSVSTTTYRVQMVTEGSVKTTLSSSGTLTPVRTETEYAVYPATVSDIKVQLRDTVREGDVLMVLELDDENELLTQLEELENTLASTDRVASTKYIKSSSKGVVKDIKVVPGDDIEKIMSQYGYLARVSLDGLMKVSIPASSLSKYDTVTVKDGKKSYTGTVQEIKKGIAEIIIEDTKPLVGAMVEVIDTAGQTVGTGAMDLVSYSEIEGVDGFVKLVSVVDNQVISRNGKFCLCSDYPTASTYSDTVSEIEDLNEDIEEATVIKAPFDGKILEIDVKTGDTVEAETALLVIQSLEGYTVSLSVDELDIASLKLGQKATVELDAIEGKFEGVLDYISYVNASTGKTVRYTAGVSVGDIDGALPSMSATCTIVTSDSGNGLLVPAESVINLNGKTVVYKAPEGATFGSFYNETDIDLNMLTSVEVTVRQSDGNNLLVDGDLKKNDLVLVRRTVTSATYSSSSNNNANGFSFDFGGMGGGMPNMSGMPNMGGFGGNNNWGGNNNNSSGNNNRSNNGGSNNRSRGN